MVSYFHGSDIRLLLIPIDINNLSQIIIQILVTFSGDIIHPFADLIKGSLYKVRNKYIEVCFPLPHFTWNDMARKK